MAQPAKAEENNHDQAVKLSPRPLDWAEYLASGSSASEEFMDAVEELPAQERVIFESHCDVKT